MLDFLIKQGVSVNAKTNFGGTALIGATEMDKPEAVAFLLTHGANPNAQNSDGETALHRAFNNDMHNPNRGIIRLLLRKHASLFVKNKTGKMPLDALNFVRRFDPQYVVREFP